MTLLLDTVIPRTLTQLVERFTAQPVTRIEAWLFDDVAARRAGEEALAKAGVAAVLRGAYEPLVHFFLEEFGNAPGGRRWRSCGLHPRRQGASLSAGGLSAGWIDRRPQRAPIRGGQGSGG
ncbi:hypothetical protein [Variovorax sp. VRV01]|uniref:hypothetical protein n=1 Tax=Variovorax sp. VRV01 TaxID=2769259 RepID=UPI001CE06507|nr:hypothetical protein [Variovorax sp. VRV01]